MDPILIVKVLFLQSIYNLVDGETEKELTWTRSKGHVKGGPAEAR
ncbi:MAG: hypothetical protein QXU18_13930 [Thermoplasmatales archaeon]